MSDDDKTWERRDDETDRAWAAFKTYRDMPPHRRSIANVVRALRGPDARVEGDWFYELSSKHAWSARVRDFDRHMDKAAQSALKRARTTSFLALANSLEELVGRAIEDAKGGDASLLRDLMDRAGLTPEHIQGADTTTSGQEFAALLGVDLDDDA